jgi:hypothetical protein
MGGYHGASMAEERIVRMYSRRTCGLCDKARAVILAERERAAAPFRLEEVLIDGNDELEREYGVRVPVVEIDGVEAFEIAVEPTRFRELLGRPSRSA